MRQGLKRAPFALILTAALASSFAGASARALAQDETGPFQAASPPAVARIAAVEGQVSVKHGDGGEEAAAAMNAPLIAGDYLNTGPDGMAEIQLDDNTILRAGSDTQMRFTQLDGQADVAQIAEGTMELRVLQSDPDQIQIQTPSVDVEPSEPGAYLISVKRDGHTEVTARSGSLAVVTPQGTQEVDPGRTMEIAGNASNPEYQYVDEVAQTGVEQWGDQRDQQMLAEENQAPPDQGDASAYNVAGMSDLNQDGNWVDIPGYGEAWVPNDVSPSWTPYSDGQWAYEPYYGYTWVAAEPWGWAPYHYGRWAYAAPYGWAWVPGEAYARTAWSPALVAFVGFGGAGVGVGYNNIGWVPLAPGEAYRPWYGGGRLGLSVSVNNYRNYAHGFIGVSYNTFAHGAIRNAHPMASWQRFNATAPSYARGYAQSYNRGYQQTYNRAYPSYARGYAQNYNRGYAQTYNRGYAQTYNRGYAQTYSRGYAQTYNRGYRQSYNRGYGYAPRQSYQRQAFTRSSASRQSYGGGRGRGPGRP